MFMAHCWLLFAAAYAQTFDAASIKPGPKQPPDFIDAPPPGGPGTSDPGRIRYTLISLRRLITTAYDVKDFQISGPDWLGTTRFNVEATKPPTTTKEQFRVMLQNLLAERFGVTLHRETNELPIYALETAKGGIKMKPSGAGRPVPAEYGFPAPPANLDGRPRTMEFQIKDRARLVAYQQTIADLGERLTPLLSRPVVDATGRTETFDFTLTFSLEASANADPEAPPDIFVALRTQLGLRLDAKKGPVDLLVIDRIYRVPTEP